MKIITFDVEDWYHILANSSTAYPSDWVKYEPRFEQNTYRILDYLDEINQKGTFFCLAWMAERFPHVIKRMSDSGHEVASHSHEHQLVYQQKRKDFEDDLDRSIKILQDITGKKITSYRAPGFSITEKSKYAFEILISHGIEVDSSVFPASRMHGGFHNFQFTEPCIINTASGSIKEFPINIFPVFNFHIVFSGGGYFRFFNYSIIRYMMKRSDYVMSYFHPRDFDPGQPMIEELHPMRRFMSYTGLKHSFKKFRRYMKDYDFISLADADKKIDWSKKPVVQI